jgi:hypothetical protein
MSSRAHFDLALGGGFSQSDFRLYAICSRYAHNLASEAGLQEMRSGVYDCRRGSDAIRTIVGASNSVGQKEDQ